MTKIRPIRRKAGTRFHGEKGWQEECDIVARAAKSREMRAAGRKDWERLVDIAQEYGITVHYIYDLEIQHAENERRQREEKE